MSSDLAGSSYSAELAQAFNKVFSTVDETDQEPQECARQHILSCAANVCASTKPPKDLAPTEEWGRCVLADFVAKVIMENHAADWWPNRDVVKD